MTIEQYESSPEEGEPIELYRFQYGVGKTFLYTNDAYPFEFDGETYEPLPIERTGVESKAKIEDVEITVSVPLWSEIAQIFLAYPPPQVVSLIARQGHRIDQDAEFPVFFTGRVLEAERKDEKCNLACELSGASMKRPGLRRHYQWACPLVLYGDRCRAPKEPATFTARVKSSGPGGITLEPGWMPAETPAGEPAEPTDFVGGMVEWQGSMGPEFEAVLRVDGDTLVTAGIKRDLVPGQEIKVSFGCPHTLKGCGRVHGNTLNYGGQPYIPVGSNPIHKNTHM